MLDMVPNAATSRFAETFCSAAAAVFSQASGAPWTVQLSHDRSTGDGVDNRFVYQLSCSGSLEGHAVISLSSQDALGLAQKFLAEALNPAAEFTDNHQQTVRELLQQVSGILQSTLSQQHGEVKLHLSPIDSSASDATTLPLLASAGGQEFCLLLQIMPDLAAALVSDKQAASSGDEQINELRASLNLALLLGIDLNLTLRFGRSKLTLDQILALSSGAVIELDHQIHEPVELLLGDRLVASGDVVVVDDNYGLQVNTVRI